VFKILAAPLTVTAANAARLYGAANPSFTGTITGIQNGDAITATYATVATSASPVATYAIVPTLVDPGSKLGNYVLTSNKGTFSVTPAPLLGVADNATKVYGAPLPNFTVSYSGFVNGDAAATLSGTPSFATPASGASPVGSYALTPSGLTSANYTIAYANGTLTVTAAPLTVTAYNATRQYGLVNPAFSGTITGLQNGDNITATYSTTATPASGVGGYAISPSLVDPGSKLGNYAVTSNKGTLTVTAAPLTIAANNAAKPYGAPLPAFTASYGGFVNADMPGNLGGALTFATPATAGSPVGSYVITPSGQVSTNYTIILVNGMLTVTQAVTTTTLSTSPNPSNFGQSVNLTANVAVVAPGAGAPTGTITFQDGGTTLGTGTLISNMATLSTSSLAPGSHSLTATYSGAVNFMGSSSSPVSQLVVCGVLVAVSPSSVALGNSISVTGSLRSCATVAQTVVVQFTWTGPLQSSSCSSTNTVMFTTPPFTLPANTQKTMTFPYSVPNNTCLGKYTITATTLVSGKVVDTSSTTLTVTAH
jgi:hypothetical protein